jgi:hypothetical protein
MAPLAPIIGIWERDLGIGIRQRLSERRRHPAEQIEREEPAMAARVLDVVPEHPEIEHVAGEVHEPAVQEHRGQQGQRRRHHDQLSRQLRVFEQDRRDEAVAVHHGGAGARIE